MVSNHSLLGKHLPITNPTIGIEHLKPKDPWSRKIFTRRVRKEYCKQNVLKEKATLAEKSKWFWKGAASITNKNFVSTFKPKLALFISQLEESNKWCQPIFRISMQEDKITLQKHKQLGILSNSGKVLLKENKEFLLVGRIYNC